jgi:RNA polymerase sigma-54 factor
MNRVGIVLEQRLEQRLVITPQLQQAIKLLQLNRAELTDVLQEELLDNPMLEETEGEEEERLQGEEPPLQEEIVTEPVEEVALKELSSTEGEMVSDDPFDDFDWESFFEEEEAVRRSMPSMRESFEDEIRPTEVKPSPYTDLTEHLLEQLRLVRMKDEEQQMCVLMIEQLNDDGWFVFEDTPDEDPLDLLTEEMLKIRFGNDEGELLCIEREGERTPTWTKWRRIARKSLRFVQMLEPYGVGARDLKECLLLQWHQRENRPLDTLVERLITDHLDDLERNNYNAIGKGMRVSLEEIIRGAEQISKLSPYPGRLFSSDATSYITPDIHVKKIGSRFTVSLNDDGLPKLRISQRYKEALQTQNAEQKEFVQEKFRNATWLLRSIYQRQRTVFKVAQSIVERQKDFLEHGVQHLRPMVLRDVAEDIDMHESTVSRVTTNKYIHTPQGVYELKFFFTSSLQSTKGGADVSSLSVKDKIKQLIDGEDPKSPLSDQKIVSLLKREGIVIARRTVAKYRGVLGIPSSSRRKQPY